MLNVYRKHSKLPDGIFGEGKSHSTLNTYRSAISMSGRWHFLSVSIQHFADSYRACVMHVHRAYNNLECGHIRSRPPSKVLDLKELSCKLVTLLALANADRASDIHLLDLQHATYREARVIFQIAGLNKTRRSGPPREVSYVRFLDCPDTCPVETLRVYEQRTQPLRGEATSLLVACVKPHKPVATSTMSRWIKNMLEQAGIHANAHSTRSAATSTGIHTGGRERGDFPPPPPPFKNPPPPLLNQHKYYDKVVLKHNQQQSDKCCSKMVCICSKTSIIFQRCILAVKTFVIGTVSW